MERPERLLTARVRERETGASARCEGQRGRDRSVCSLRGSEREGPERLLTARVRERERPERLLAARVGERETGASENIDQLERKVLGKSRLMG